MMNQTHGWMGGWAGGGMGIWTVIGVVAVALLVVVIVNQSRKSRAFAIRRCHQPFTRKGTPCCSKFPPTKR
jgi:hypothetical protein